MLHIRSLLEPVVLLDLTATEEILRLSVRIFRQSQLVVAVAATDIIPWARMGALAAAAVG
jgi:hypothetical protein